MARIKLSQANLTRARRLSALLLPLLALTSVAAAQLSASQQFPPGSLTGIQDLPPSPLRNQLERLPGPARERALGWLRGFHFTALDLRTLNVDSDGGIYYADTFTVPQLEPAEETTPGIAAAAVPVSPFSDSLVFHSRPGAPNVLFLNFCGENVSNTAWNSSINRSVIPAVAFSTDADFTTFSDAEQVAIKRIWERVAEDYAPFNVDVTTERPATFSTRTGHALITRNTDENGQSNPSSSAGGVGYVGVFGKSSYATYRPVWVYYNNLASQESYIAEAASHELGHNLGLSHDGQTSGVEYYGGHGSGDTSWGPIMGTGYNRNVSQWSKGEYYLANNTEDDLAIIAGLLTYAVDDHGDTFASATGLLITGRTNIISTTPEIDPANTNRANKGILQRNTDTDMFSFATGSGAVDITVNPWIQPAGTHGGNADLLVQLYDSNGTLLLTDNSSSVTYARIQTNLVEGVYYLAIKGTGTGTPLSSSPSGYTAYASLGQYFISGKVVASSLVVPPHAELQVADVTSPGAGAVSLTIRYTDNIAVNAASIDNNDLRVTGPNAYDQLARVVSVSPAANASPVTAIYVADPPNGATWLPADKGTYTVWLRTNEVNDVEGAWVAAGQLGQFTVDVPVALYSADMKTDPGWSLEPLWGYGAPAYASIGPVSGFTGQNIIAYNLSGSYERRLSPKYATTPPINCSGADSLTLRFQRWLGLKNGDTASIDVSTNGTVWVPLWSTTATVADGGWREVQYALPSWTARSPSVQLRWGIAADGGASDIGWNIDDVQLLAGGSLDTLAPSASLSIANLTTAGSPGHSFAVTYTDDTAVRVSSLSSSNIVVIGPNNYSNMVDYLGVDVPTDGTPRVASYSVPAPNGAWSEADNGSYQLVLADGQVMDIYNNEMPEMVLGTLTVSIPTNPIVTNVTLTATCNNTGWGFVSPTNGTYTPGVQVVVTATPAAFFRFAQWTGDVSSTVNPLTVTLERNTLVHAVFAEIVTTNHPTPYWWLASWGETQDFEAAVDKLGANGMPLWQSYVAGLTPTNPASQLTLSVTPGTTPGSVVFSWNTVTGRLYTIESSTNLLSGFTAEVNTSNLPPNITAVTNQLSTPAMFNRLRVERQ